MCEDRVSNIPYSSDILQSVSVLGLPMHLVQDYPRWIMHRLEQGLGCHVITLNAEMTMQAEETPVLAHIIHQAELVIPDGSGIVFYMRIHGKRVQRMPGIELAQTLLERSTQFGEPWSIFFFGGAPGVADTAAEHWQKKVPEISIVGTQNGYLKSEDEREFLDRLKTLQPRLIYVGLGVPRQELWISQHRHICPNSVWIGVGGSFDVWAGTKERAPQWFCDNHLEWLYRLYQEPWRWKRMMALPKFAARAIVYRLTKQNPVSEL
ncbi:WecB/TagA/CpsF family glycosyltransferase [Leptolyngbya boryana CZ1]|uniref:WecB/TagA/CpsF family glycosyltransferase n=1 Tax=Leptolyngbya boryana CZ1 TaxID=3060204 RepID=A0AA97ARP5_LEPBY|nr:WecB/TagA/CpsF family glycosyltransferase [Leptolyngbya boryana]WNZ44320.1 WecB/TagA/CpsF family glycosyltransferase [Leptolyngbya boryana CZ1]